MSTTDDYTGVESPHANQREDNLEHVNIRNSGEPDELFVIPADATAEECETAWMKATGDAFVDLANWQ